MMRGRFKLAIQRTTTAHFAVVEVGLMPGPEDAVLIRCPIRGKGWIDPIIVGVEEALHEMRQRGALTQPVQVEVLDFQGLYVDTLSLQAKTAAFVATARAVLGSNE